MLEKLSNGGQLTYDLTNTIALCHVEDYCPEPTTTGESDQLTAMKPVTAGGTAASLTPAAATSAAFVLVSTAAAAAAAASTDEPVTPIAMQSSMHSSSYSAATDVQVRLMSL
jgi:hypothetical protein